MYFFGEWICFWEIVKNHPETNQVNGLKLIDTSWVSKVKYLIK